MIYTEKSIGTYDQLENAGFVRCMYLVESHEVLGIMDPVRFKNDLPGLTVPVNGISVVTDPTIIKIERLPFLGTFEEPRVEGSQGTTYQPIFSFEFPRNTPELLQFLTETEGKRYVAIWEDRNGFAHITGNEDNGLRLQASRQIKDLNGVALQLTAQMPIPTWGLESIALAETFLSGEFNYEFLLHFNA